VAATPRCDEINNGSANIVQRPTGPRHVGEIIGEIIWQLTVVREAQRAEAQP
jgi:hypothetical protein